MGTFSATIGDWAKNIQGAEEVVFKEAVQDLVTELNSLAPVDTGFLRASLRASTTAMPVLSLDNPGGTHTLDAGSIELVILGADITDKIYLGYTAKYGAHVHYGANGRPGRPWVLMAAQRWPQIVQTVATRVKGRLGL